MAGPPPPPPPPGVMRGPGGPGPFGPAARPQGGGGPPPPPGVRPPGGLPGGPPPQFAPQPRPPRNSTTVIDVRPSPMLDEKTSRKKLTTYAVFTIKKAPSLDPKDTPTWGRSEIVEEHLAQGDISKQIKSLNDGKKAMTVAEKKAALAPNQQRQITKLMDRLASSEGDQNFEWSLAQIDRREQNIKHTQKKETTTMTVYVTRGPQDGVNPLMLYHAIERAKMERFQQQNRPPNEDRGGNNPEPQMIKIEPGNGPRPKGKSPPRAKRRSKHYHDDSSSMSSDFTSDTDSMSDMGSSNTSHTASTRSKGHGGRRYSYNRGHRSHSHHREPREHRKTYYIEDRTPSPVRRVNEVYDGGPPAVGVRPAPFAPEVPRSTPGFDPVTAAYQAGKIDADAEHFGLSERERYPHPQPPAPRPLVIERTVPVIIDQPRDPRAIVSYGRGDRYAEERYPDSPMSPRYDSRWADEGPRDYHRGRSEYQRREMEAEEYMDRPFDDRPYGRSFERLPERPFDPRPPFVERRATEPRSYRDPPAFVTLPRRYPTPPSVDSFDPRDRSYFRRY